MSLLELVVVASAAETSTPLPAWAYAAIAFAFFLFLAFVVWSFRDVANRHSHKTDNRGRTNASGPSSGQEH